jgi:hypothetical protein
MTRNSPLLHQMRDTDVQIQESSITLKIHDNLTRKKRPFHPIHPGKVRPVRVQSHRLRLAPVDHAMSSPVFDMMRGCLEYKGLEVRQVVCSVAPSVICNHGRCTECRK